MFIRKKIFLLVLSCWVFSSAGYADSNSKKNNRLKIETAFKICDILNATGIVNECDVSGFSKVISFRVDANAKEGKKICNQVSNMEGNHVFRNQWKIEVYSPFSGDHVVASCSL